MNSSYIKDIVARVIEQDIAFRQRYISQWGGPPYGYGRTLTDEQFRVWFQSMVARDPDWTRALPYLKDATLTKNAGSEELKRYQKVAGIDNAGV